VRSPFDVVALVGRGGAAAAASASAVSTVPATAVGPTTATVSGRSPERRGDYLALRYGTYIYGSTTASATSSRAQASVAGLAAPAHGLNRERATTIAIVATNGSGPAHGGDGMPDHLRCPQLSRAAPTT